jgi:hypothetical protein
MWSPPERPLREVAGLNRGLVRTESQRERQVEQRPVGLTYWTPASLCRSQVVNNPEPPRRCRCDRLAET